MRQNKVDRLADELLLELRKYPQSRLPPLREMASAHGVSVSTMAKAARKLESQGIVEMGRGRRIEVVSDRPAIRPAPTSAEVLHASLRHKILNGYFRVGEALPKISYAAGEARVSAHTVLKAYRMLVDKNLAFKRGRAWIAGPQPDSFAELTSQNPPVIFLLQTRERSWRSLCYAERTSQFCRTFTSEAEERGVRLLPVFSTPYSSPGGVFAGGYHEVVALARRLGTRYLGTLIAASSREVEDLAQWGAVLTGLGKPVVWFDRYDELFDEDIDRKLFSRCHFSEERAIAECVEFLYESGHRVIAYANLYPDRWRTDRLVKLREAAGRYGPQVRILNSMSPGNWSAGDDELIDGLIGTLTSSPYAPIQRIVDVFRARARDSSPSQDPETFASATLRSMLRSLRNGPADELSEFYQHARIVLYAPVLNELLANPEITAIVTPHDWDARHMYYTLETSGLSIPGLISLISFDNSILLHPLPVTSVDFGFGYLGYCAFHLLLGDIHIDRDAHGNVPAHPRIVNRGSVAVPRKRPLEL